MIVEYFIVGLVGLVLGSFAGASVWRLRARQLVEDKAMGESVDAKELRQLKPLIGHNVSQDRSRCLHCNHVLAWHDLVPLLSWLRTGGKCAYCKQPIGAFEPTIELATAALFVGFHWLWTQGGLGQMYEPLFAISSYILWLGALVMLVILFAYDSKWFLLPDRVMFPLIAVGAVIAGVRIVVEPNGIAGLGDTIVAIAILSGIYLALWFVSKGRLIGFGDVKLGLALGLLLGSWQLAFLALFSANLIGTLLVAPQLITKKMSRGTQIPFGPLMIAGFVIALWFGEQIIGGYTSMMAGFTATLLML